MLLDVRSNLVCVCGGGGEGRHKLRVSLFAGDFVDCM